MSNLILPIDKHCTVEVIVDYEYNTPCELLVSYHDWGTAAYLSVAQMRELARFLLEQAGGQL